MHKRLASPQLILTLKASLMVDTVFLLNRERFDLLLHVPDLNPVWVTNGT